MGDPGRPAAVARAGGAAVSGKNRERRKEERAQRWHARVEPPRGSDEAKEREAKSMRVELPDVAPLVVHGCRTEEEAYERYKEIRGIVASDHRPTIEEVER